jgi:MinD superfamily P-loop ATPase
VNPGSKQGGEGEGVDSEGEGGRDEGAAEAVNYCDAEGIEMLSVIPDDRRVAEACSQGMPASHASESYAHSMMGLYKRADRRLAR